MFERMNRFPYLLPILATMLWGGNFVIGRAVIDQIPPFSLAFLRWTVASLLFLPFVYKQLIQEKSHIISYWKELLLMAISGIAGFNTLVYVGLNYTTSINASLVNTLSPVLIIVFSYFMIGEKIRPQQLIGLVVSLLGVILIFSKGSLHVLLSLSFNPGDLVMLTAVILWAFYSIIIKRISQVIPLHVSLAISMIMGVIILIPFAFWERYIALQYIQWLPTTIASILYIGIAASIVAFLAWNRAIAVIGATNAGIFLSLIPVFTTLFATLFINETLAWFQAFGGLLAITGIYLSTYLRK